MKWKPGYFRNFYKKLTNKCTSKKSEKRPSFDDILEKLRTDESFITSFVDKNDFLDYVDFIDNYKTTFGNKVIKIDQYVKRKSVTFTKVTINNGNKNSNIKIGSSSSRSKESVSTSGSKDKSKSKRFSLFNKNKNKMNEAVPQENENIEYIHVFITNDLLGKINFDNSCFDTESIHSNDSQIVGLNNDDKEINNELISTKNNKIDNYESERPLIVDELIDQFF